MSAKSSLHSILQIRDLHNRKIVKKLLIFKTIHKNGKTFPPRRASHRHANGEFPLTTRLPCKRRSEAAKRRRNGREQRAHRSARRQALFDRIQWPLPSIYGHKSKNCKRQTARETPSRRGRIARRKRTVLSVSEAETPSCRGRITRYFPPKRAAARRFPGKWKINPTRVLLAPSGSGVV